VALAFIGKRPDGFAIDHIDCNKLNNVVNNLEYVTIRENNRRAIENGCIKKGVENPHCSIKSKEIESEIIRLRYEEKWSYKKIAEKYNLSRSAIYRSILRCGAYKNIGRVSGIRGPYNGKDQYNKNYLKYCKNKQMKVHKLLG
jgi:DNA invertase Pin-like site-specific DNA recombinase